MPRESCDVAWRLLHRLDQGRLDLADSWLALATRSLDIWPRTYGHPIPLLTRANLAIVRQQCGIAKDLLRQGA